MGKLRFYITISLDGFMAGPRQSLESPLGVGGEQLHTWALALESWRRSHNLPGGETNESTAIADEQQSNVGAVIMGRNMFGGQPGAWSAAKPWNGWWGDDPPFHTPVFVLTHHAREPLVMKGGTTFHFVTDGALAAFERARQAAAGKDITLGGGASTAQQYLNAGLIDEINVTLAPIILGSGERLFDRIDPKLKLEQTRVVQAPGVTHLRYRVCK